MNLPGNDFTNSEATHQSINEQIKVATEPIFRQFENLRALLACRNKLETTGNREATSSRRDDTSASSADNRYENDINQCYFVTVNFLVN